MFFYTLLILFVFLPLSISAGNKLKREQPLNKYQIRLFINLDHIQRALGKNYQYAWWAWWVILALYSLTIGAWISAAAFVAYVWSRLRFQKIVARPATAVDATN